MRSAALLLLVATALATQDKSKPGGRETELRRLIASGLVDLASWCHDRKLTTEGRALADEALGLDAANAKAKDLKPKLAGDSEGSEADRKEYAKKLETYGRKLSGLYRELFAQKHPPAEQARFDAYLVRAYELDAKAAGPLIDAESREAAGRKDWARAYRLLSGAERVKNEPARAKALRDVECRAAETSAILKKATAHTMQYYLALPKDWSAAKKWPILVAVEGAGCNWTGMMNAYLGQRGDRPFILVVPVTFSNTNALAKDKYPYPQEVLDEADRSGRLGFDEPGLLAALDDVRRDYAGQEKFFITGFSGGGNLCWRMTFGHPDKLAASAPACANFANPGPLSDAPERESLPIKAFQGDKDEYLQSMLEAQWQAAKKLLDERGYKTVSRVMLPGVGHSGCAKEVLDFFTPLAKRS